MQEMSWNLNHGFTANQGLQNLSIDYGVIAIQTLFSSTMSDTEWVTFFWDVLYIIEIEKSKEKSIILVEGKLQKMI